MNLESRLTKGIYFAPDPRPSPADDIVRYECRHCGKIVTWNKTKRGLPSSADEGPCYGNRNGGGHLWVLR